MKNKLLFSTLTMISFGCSSYAPGPVMPPPPIVESNATRDVKLQPPIYQIREVANLAAGDMRAMVVANLNSQGARIAEDFDNDDFKFETTWIETKGNGCQTERYSGAPIYCRTKLYFRIEPITETAASLDGKYQQICNVSHEQEQICAGSIGERLLLGIANLIETAI